MLLGLVILLVSWLYGLFVGLYLCLGCGLVVFVVCVLVLFATYLLVGLL